MSIIVKSLAFGAGLAALGAAVPASAQYYPYGNSYGYGYTYNNANFAAQRCAAAVQQRLSYRGRAGYYGYSSYNRGRVISITQVVPRSQTVRVRGVASSGRMAYNRYPHGIGAFGMLGANYHTAADLSFRCSVDYRGYVRDVDIRRR